MVPDVQRGYWQVRDSNCLWRLSGQNHSTRPHPDCRVRGDPPKWPLHRSESEPDSNEPSGNEVPTPPRPTPSPSLGSHQSGSDPGKYFPKKTQILPRRSNTSLCWELSLSLATVNTHQKGSVVFASAAWTLETVDVVTNQRNRKIKTLTWDWKRKVASGNVLMQM